MPVLKETTKMRNLYSGHLFGQGANGILMNHQVIYIETVITRVGIKSLKLTATGTGKTNIAVKQGRVCLNA